MEVRELLEGMIRSYEYVGNRGMASSIQLELNRLNRGEYENDVDALARSIITIITIGGAL